MRGLVLSLFPGIGLLDMAFEEAGYCVVRGPDVIWGGDIRKFHPPARCAAVDGPGDRSSGVGGDGMKALSLRPEHNKSTNKEEEPMTDEPNTLVFDAALSGLKLKGGEFELTFKIVRPKTPQEPSTWGLDGGEPVLADFEGDEKAFKDDHKRWEKADDRHRKAVEEYGAAQETLQPRLRSYAAIVGMSAVLDGKSVVVEIRPGEQQILDGFGVQLLAPVDPVIGA